MVKLLPCDHEVMGSSLGNKRTGRWPSGKPLDCERYRLSSIPIIDSGLTGACPHM
jgi:hypothetical protein